MVINPVVYDEKGVGNDVFSSNLANRVIHLVGEITDEMSASIVAQLLHLAASGDEDIQMYINSPGGCVSAGMAIYDTMQFIKPQVSTVCVGRAASMGAVILSGGEKGKRLLLPHSEVMIHQPSGGMAGMASDMLIVADHIKDIKKTLTEILSENCGRATKELERDMERDYWMKAQEAVDYGVADSILR